MELTSAQLREPALGGVEAESFSSTNVSPNNSFVTELQTNAQALKEAIEGSRFVYELWPTFGGNSQFCCKGWCITGPKIDFWFHTFTWCVILLPTTFYFCVCAEPLWHHVSPLLPLISTAAFCSTITLLLLTSCTDPGIIPRPEFQLAVPGLISQVAESTGAPRLQVEPGTLTPVELLTQEDVDIGWRWCTTCKLMRPPRASHCRDCDNCVLRFDHHCPFVNNCIGQRNYAFFSGFLVSAVALGLCVFSGIAIWIWTTSQTEPQAGGIIKFTAEEMWIVLAITALPAAIALPALLGLLCFHFWLSCRGRTTKEVLTRQPIRARQGSEFCETVFHPRGPALLRGRAVVRYDSAAVSSVA